MRVRRFTSEGGVRGFWDDSDGSRDRALGHVPRRASRVEVIEEGPHAGRFHVDLAPLAEHVNRPEWAICLLPPEDDYRAAVRREQDWVLRHWILEEPWNPR